MEAVDHGSPLGMCARCLEVKQLHASTFFFSFFPLCLHCLVMKLRRACKDNSRHGIA